VKEDGMLFPMADEMLSPEGQKRVLDGFDRVERKESGEGAHEKFHALAEKLEGQGRLLSD
jgi:hemerythrin-like domain-containing protein